ncbi:hypothetical protein ACWKSP_06535 [Micromonosporaceae bacterium Da 78-11]
MGWTLDQAWDWQRDCAQAFDDSRPGRSSTWPPNMTSLVMAAATSGLRRLYPFTRYQSLRFATSPEWYLGAGEIAPAGVDLVTDPLGYVVWSGRPLDAAPHRIAETTDPIAAVTHLEQLLTGWPAAPGRLPDDRSVSGLRE